MPNNTSTNVEQKIHQQILHLFITPRKESMICLLTSCLLFIFFKASENERKEWFSNWIVPYTHWAGLLVSGFILIAAESVGGVETREFLFLESFQGMVLLIQVPALRTTRVR